MTLHIIGTTRRARVHRTRVHVELKETSEPPSATPTLGYVEREGSFARLLVEWKLAQNDTIASREKSA